MKFPLLAVAATRVCAAATVTALFCVPAAAQRVDYSRLEITATDLGYGVYLLGCASGTIGGDGGYPFFDIASGGSLAGMIAAEDKLLALSDDKTRIVADEGEPEDTITRLAYQSLKSVRP